MILCWKKGSANKKKGFHLFNLGFDVSNFYDEARFFSSLTFTLPLTTLNIHMNAACLPAKHSSTFHEVFPGCWRRSRVVTFIERSGKKFQLKFSKVDNERWRGAGRTRARYIRDPWNNNDVDVLFLRAGKADVQFTCFIHRCLPSAGEIRDPIFARLCWRLPKSRTILHFPVHAGPEIYCTQAAYMASLFYTKSSLHLLLCTKRFQQK